MEDFLRQLEIRMESQTMVKLTLSKPRQKGGELQNVFIRPVMLKGEPRFQVSKRTKTQDFVSNHEAMEVPQMVLQLLKEDFFNADLFCTDGDYHLLQSKKGKIKVIFKQSKREQVSTDHNRKKTTLIDAKLPYLQDLKITSDKGKIFAGRQKKYKQINKYVEIVSSLIDSKKVKQIFDMGSGKGYLTFALHDYLSSRDPHVKMKGIEIRKDLVELCNSIAQKNDMKGLSFEEGSIDSYEISEADMIIALHACDIATDMAIAQGIKAKAQYIITAPCCHKQIRKEMKNHNSVISPLLQHGILLERQAEMITDGIRALLLESRGYDTKVFEFISSEHTGKNIMITAEYTGVVNKKALKEIEAIKSEMGIGTHFLETII